MVATHGRSLYQGGVCVDANEENNNKHITNRTTTNTKIDMYTKKSQDDQAEESDASESEDGELRLQSDGDDDEDNPKPKKKKKKAVKKKKNTKKKTPAKLQDGETNNDDEEDDIAEKNWLSIGFWSHSMTNLLCMTETACHAQLVSVKTHKRDDFMAGEHDKCVLSCSFSITGLHVFFLHRRARRQRAGR